MDLRTKELIDNILYSSHLIILAKGVMDNYPFYSYEEGKWLIKAIKISIDKDWVKEMQGLAIFIKDDLVMSYRYRAWLGRNYVPVENVFLPGDWIYELQGLRDKVIQTNRKEELVRNNNILNNLKNV